MIFVSRGGFSVLSTGLFVKKSLQEVVGKNPMKAKDMFLLTQGIFRNIKNKSNVGDIPAVDDKCIVHPVCFSGYVLKI